MFLESGSRVADWMKTHIMEKKLSTPCVTIENGRLVILMQLTLIAKCDIISTHFYLLTANTVTSDKTSRCHRLVPGFQGWQFQ